MIRSFARRRLGVSSLLLVGLLAASAAQAAAWRAVGPFGGTVDGLARCVRSPATVYLMNQQGGISRSDDAGRTWRPANGDLPSRLALNFLGLVVHPSNPQSVWLTTRDQGVFHTRDGGAHWSSVSVPSTSAERGLALAVTVEGTVFVGNSAGMFRSADDGRTWVPLRGGLPRGYGVVSIAVDFFDSRLAYAAVRGTEPGVYVTHDGGARWQRTLTRSFARDVAELRANPYLAGSVAGGTYFQLLHSSDGGRSWRTLTQEYGLTGFNFVGRSKVLLLTVDQLGGSSTSRVDTDSAAIDRVVSALPPGPLVLDPDPRDEGVQLLGTFATLFRTEDGGEHWLPSDQGFVGNHFVPAVAATSRTTLFAATSWTTDGGAHWKRLPFENLVADFAKDPFDGNVLYAALGYPTSVQKSVDGGQTWRATGSLLRNSEAPTLLRADDRHPGTLYVGVGRYPAPTNGLFRTVDGGDHWTRIGAADIRSVAGFDLAPSADGGTCLYVANFSGLLRSCDDGQTWTTLLPREARAFGAVAVAPSDARWIYALESYRSEWATVRMYVSRDGGASFETVELPLSSIESLVESETLRVDPLHPDVVYLGLALFYHGGVWRRSGDGPWEDLTPGLFNTLVYSLVLDQRSRQRLLVGTQAGMQVLNLDR